MFDKTKKRLGELVGVTGDRAGNPPAYRAIAPGLILTDDSAWGWYVVRTTNSDLLSEQARDREQDSAERALRPLIGRECHLSTPLWSQLSGRDYFEGLDLGPYDDPDDEKAQAIPANVWNWAQLRAGRIDELGMESSLRLMGVRLAELTPGWAERASAALGVREQRVSPDVLAKYRAMSEAIGKKLSATVWRAQLASPELLAWKIAREMHRDAPIPTPHDGVISGAPLHRLTAGKVVPFPDHLVFMAGDGRPAAYGAILYLSDFPETIETPGQEWLACLNGLETSPLADGTTTDEIPVLAEGSVRFTPMPPKPARDLVDDARKLAKEQRQSAARYSAGEPDEHIQVAEEEAIDMGFRLRRNHTVLVATQPRVVVSAASRADLDAKIAAVMSCYENIGITASLGEDEQRELWLESLPCDHVRVSDMGHPMDSTCFVASWFWGGSKVGSTDPRMPAVGYTTGSTQQLVRFLATEGADKQSAPLVLFLGKTRRGKTTAMMQSVLDAILAPTNIGREPLAYMFEFKGDAAAGIAEACEAYDVPHTVQEITDANSAGCLDAFVTSETEHQVSHSVEQLGLLLPPKLLEQGEQYLHVAADHVARDDAEPRNWKVIRRLIETAENASDNTVLNDMAATLKAVSRSGWGALVAGRPTVEQQLPETTGVHVMLVPGMAEALPGSEVQPKDWSSPQRQAVAAQRGLLAMATTAQGRPANRSRAKLVAIPEAHVLFATSDGKQFCQLTARMAAAHGTNLLMDTQDVTGVYETKGLAEAIHTVFVFAQDTEEEQDAAARMAGLTADTTSRDVISSLDVADELMGESYDSDPIRRGHCLMRDGIKQAATVQWDIPTGDLIEYLDTSPAGNRRRLERRAARAAEQEQAAEADQTDYAVEVVPS